GIFAQVQPGTRLNWQAHNLRGIYPRAFDNSSEVRTYRKRTEGSSPVSRQPRSTERFGHSRLPILHEQGSLQDQRHLLNETPRAYLYIGKIAQFAFELSNGGIEASIHALSARHFRQERLR